MYKELLFMWGKLMRLSMNTRLDYCIAFAKKILCYLHSQIKYYININRMRDRRSCQRAYLVHV